MKVSRVIVVLLLVAIAWNCHGHEVREVKKGPKPTFGSNWDVLYSATYKDGKTVVHKDTSQDTSKNEEQEVADDAQPECFSKYMNMYSRFYKFFDKNRKLRPDDAAWQKKYDHKIQISVCSKMRSKVARSFDRECKGKQEKAEFMEAWFEKAPDCRKDDEDTNKNEEQEVKKPTFGSNWDVLYSATHKDGKTVVHKDTSQDTSKNEEQEVADDAQPKCFSKYMKGYLKIYKRFDNKKKYRPDDARWQKKLDHKILSVCSKMRSKVARYFDRKCKGKQEKAEFMEAWFEKAPDCRKDDEDTNKNEEQEVKKPTFGSNWDVLYSATHKDGKTVVHKDTSQDTSKNEEQEVADDELM